MIFSMENGRESTIGSQYWDCQEIGLSLLLINSDLEI